MTMIALSTSCVDERYDLDKISNDMHLFENGIGFPLLETGDLRFDDLLSSNDDIKANANGIYEFGTTKDRIVVDVELIEKVKISAQDLDFGTISSANVTVPNGEFSFPIDKSITTYNAVFNEESDIIDSKVTYIESVLTHDIWISEISLGAYDNSGKLIDGTTSGVSIEKMKFTDYKISLPKSLIIDKNNVSVSQGITATIDDNNILTINGEVSSPQFKIGVKVDGCNVKDNIATTHKIEVHENVKLEGDISLTINNRTGAPITQSIKIVPGVYIPEAKMDEVLAKADLKDDIENQVISVGNLPDFLKDPETSLILTNPYVPITITTDMPLEMQADVILVPKDANGNYIYDDNGRKIEVKVNDIAIHGDDHDTPGSTIFYEYIAPERIAELDNKGYDFVECPDLRKIAKKIPATIEVSGVGHNNPDKLTHFYMGEPYEVDMDYEFKIPFAVESGTKIVYSDSTTDLNSDIFSSISAKTIFANAKILNGFPADMKLSVKIYDVEGNELKGIEVIIPDEIKASESKGDSENIVPAESNLRVEIRENIQGEMSKIDKMDWIVELNFPHQGVVSKFQTLSIKIDLELPEGIDLDVDNL